MREGGRLFLGVAAIAFLLRLPFLDAGYGWDSDAWRVAAAAAAMVETGSYAAPRLPGNPVHDVAMALLWAIGPWARDPRLLNGASALVSALGAGAFALAWRRSGAGPEGSAVGDSALAGLAAASVPAVFVASVSTLDYAWGFAFVACALAAALHRHAALAGAFAALALGTRLSSAMFLPGIALLLFAPWHGRKGARPWLSAGAFVAAWVAVGLLPYLPLWLERGAAAVTWYDHGYPSLVLVLKKATVDLWGWPGAAAWGALVVAAVARVLSGHRGRRNAPQAVPTPTSLSTAMLVVDGTSVAALGAWLRLPYKAAYLVPAVPFLLLAQAHHLRPAALRALLVALLVSPWILSVYAPAVGDNSIPSPWARQVSVLGRALVVDARGPILLDHVERKFQIAYLGRIERAARLLPPGSALVVQDWLPHLRLALDRVRGPLEKDGVLYTHLLDRASVERLRSEGRVLYFLPGVELANRDRYGVDLVAAGARPLVP